MVGVGRVAAIRQLHRSAVAAKEQFWRLFPDSRVAMLILDDDATYTDVNDAACRTLGRSRNEIVGHRLGFSTASELRPELNETWTEFAHTGYIACPWQITLPDGSTIDVEAIGTRDTPEPGRHLTFCWTRPTNGDGRLSPREEEITQMLALGMTGEQIAQQLYLSPETVRTHIRNAMVHMRAQTRAQLVARALQRGLISPGP
jgi:PAS domain S-box-containing protein